MKDAIKSIVIDELKKHGITDTGVLSAIGSTIATRLDKMIPEEKKFGEEFDDRSNCDSNYVNGWNSCRDAILSAMKGLE